MGYIRIETNGTSADELWYLIGARYYDPELARWISPDPIGDSVTPGLSPYVYCVNDPINFRDPTGLAHEISAEEWDYRNSQNMWDPSGDDSYDTYIPEEEVNNWSNNYNNPSLLVSDFNYKMPQNLVESYLNNQFEYRLGQLMQINPTYKTGGWDCSGVAGYLVMGRDPSTGKFSTQDLLQGNVNGVGLTKGPLQNRDMIAFYYLGRSGREQPISGHVGVYYKGNIVDITGSANLQVREWDSWVRGYYNLAENHQFNIYRVNE